MFKEFEEYAHVYPVDRQYRNKLFAGSISDDGNEEVLWDNEKWLSTYKSIMNEVGKSLENPKIKLDEDDETLEMRARIHNTPIRITWGFDPDDASYPGFIAIEMKVSGRIKEFQLNWNPEKIPREKDGKWDEDWEEESDDLLRVFVAKGIFFEGTELFVNENITALNSLPEELKTTLYKTMWSIPISQIEIDGDPGSIRVNYDKNVIMLQDPVGDITRVIDVMVKVAEEIKTDAPKEDAEEVEEDEVESFERSTCGYCTTCYVLKLRHSCPNCGAPYTGK